MLDWLTVTSNHVPEEKHDDSSSTNLEAPETPAPLFAVRAFRSALFGTPLPIVSTDKTAQDKLANNGPIAGNVGAEAYQNGSVALNLGPPEDRGTKAEAPTSPAKGILLTPGTNKLQRKTVSFGAPRSLRENLLRSTIATGNEISPKRKNHSNADVDLRFSRQLAKDRSEPLSDIDGKYDEGDNDITVDLQEPRSRSGQHWKRQFSHYHMKSDHEMRALLKYTQNTKSFASRRDAETVDLKAKLKAALAKVATMEARVSDLASQLAQSSNTSMDTEGQADLVSQLAHQTTEVLRYKRKAEELEKASRRRSNDVHALLLEPVVAQDVDFRQLKDSTNSVASHPTSEVQRALAHADSLEKENVILKKTILRVKEEMQRYESRHKARKEEWKRRSDKSEARQAELKEKLRQQKASFESSLMQLKATHAQEVNACKQQLENIRGEKSKYSHGLQVPYNELIPSAETRVENIEGHEDVRNSSQGLTQDLLQVWTAPRASHTQSLDDQAKQDRKTDKIPTDTGNKADQIKAQPTGIEDGTPPNLHHTKQLGNLSQPQSVPYEYFDTNQESHLNLAAQALRHTYPKIVCDRPKITGSSSASSNRKSVPPDRRAAAERRVEMRRALKQQSDAVGKENTRPLRA